MRLHRLATLAVASALLLVLWPAVGVAAPEPWIVTELTSVGASGLSGSGDRIVWSESDGTHEQIFTWAAGDLSPTQLTFDACDHTEPRVSGDRFTWLTWHIEHAGYRGEPVLSAEVVTWKVGDVEPTVLTAGLHGDQPRVSGDRVVWTQVVDGSSQVFTWKAGDVSPAQLTPSDGLNRDHPEVEGDRVVWQVNDYTYPIENELFTQEIGVDAAPLRLADDSRNDYSARISGDRVVWFKGVVGEAYYRVYAWRVGEAAPVQLATGEANSYFPQASADRVVWEGYDGNVDGSHIQIFTQRIGADPAPVQLTRDARHHRWTAVSGDRAAWLGMDDSGRYQVFTQRIGVDSAPTQLTNDANVALTAPIVSGDRIWWQDSATRGIRTAVPISGQMTELAEYARDAAVSKKLVGTGKGTSRASKLATFLGKLRSAESSIGQKRYSKALTQLRSAYKACDGLNKPEDLVTGRARREVAAKTLVLVEGLKVSVLRAE